MTFVTNRKIYILRLISNRKLVIRKSEYKSKKQKSKIYTQNRNWFSEIKNSENNFQSNLSEYKYY